MRLHPAISPEDAYVELRAEAVKEYGEEGAEALKPTLRALAEAMSAISAYPLPISVAPMQG